MTNELTNTQSTDLVATLKASVYPDATIDSINLILSYCRELKLDPLLKPVHIVPMKSKEGQYRDTLMPSINLYRTMAERSETYCGINAPVFGKAITETFNGQTITYPEECTITIRKLVNGKECEFSTTERWKENANFTRDGSVNSFWARRPYGMIAKIVEAQILRKAFPSHVTHQPSIEEMHTELQDIEGERLTDAEIAVKNATNKIKTELIENKSTLLGQVSRIIIEQNINHEEIARWTHKAGVESINDLNVAQLKAIIQKYEGAK